MVLCVQSLLEKWRSAADKVPDIQEPQQDCHWDTSPKFRSPAQGSGWFCLPGRGTTHHLLMAMANQGPCSTVGTALNTHQQQTHMVPSSRAKRVSAPKS